ncbi:uncharacterized protein EV420DRAFT_478491 [Desarmillaria tabescens]|uniref:WH2 domain-containing protein n=1 Tax=Armillaria tabescens TaxID=1929756 RepID=A0AA39N544_ARMTA|nr:uncharacterized protein EV420DRAFT_478491 [Desarmillaria tabescens]KAK0457788.1 hypothetical protein EV420DRAFT_478491 [Desarmillaria tabescens]
MKTLKSMSTPPFSVLLLTLIFSTLSSSMDHVLSPMPSSSAIDSISSSRSSVCSLPGSRIVIASGQPPLAFTNSVRASNGAVVGQEHRRGPPPPSPPRPTPKGIAANIVQDQSRPRGSPPPLPPRPSPRGIAAPPLTSVIDPVRASNVLMRNGGLATNSSSPLPPRVPPCHIAIGPPPSATVKPSRVPYTFPGQGHPMGPPPLPRHSSPFGVAPRYPPRSWCKGDCSL